MKNDLWYIGNEYWAVYSEDGDIITEFKNLNEMRLSATYFHYRKRGVRAAQFYFHQGQDLSPGHCLLAYVCSRIHFDFSAALSLYRKNDSTPYSNKYPQDLYQLELFPQESPGEPRKKTKRKKSST